MLDFDGIRNYWDTRASGDSSAQSTTQDVYLREIEYRVLAERVGRLRPARVADVGCGDGRTTLRLAAGCPRRHHLNLATDPGPGGCDCLTRARIIGLLGLKLEKTATSGPGAVVGLGRLDCEEGGQAGKGEEPVS